MQVTGDAKVAVASTNTMRKLKQYLFIIGCVLCVSACSDESNVQVPVVSVFEEINLQDLRYQNLHISGWIYLEGGVRGILLIKESESRYLAFDRACTYHPKEACAQVEMHSSGFYLLDDCCGSQFDKTGNVLQGPAQQPLLQYSTSRNGNFLTIQN